MKKLTKIFMAVVALFAYSCVTDTTNDPTVDLGVGQTTVTLSFNDEVEDVVESRTHITGEKDEDGLYKLFWSKGDQIALNGVASEALGESYHGSQKAVFTVDGTHGYPRSIVYPAPAAEVMAEAEGATTFPVTFMAEQPYNFENPNTFAEGAAPMYAYIGERAGEAVSLTHLSGVMCFKPKYSGEETVTLKALVVEVAEGAIAGNFDIDCATGELTPHADATNTVTVSFGSEGLTLGSTATPIYVAVPRGEYGEVKVTLYTANNRISAIFNTEGNPINPATIRNFDEFEYNNEKNVEEGVYLIYNEESLSTFAESVSGTDAEAFNTAYPTAKVVANIDLTGKEWTSINGYTGTFDGGNYEIKGLTAPLFGTTPAAAIKNVKLENVDITATLKGSAVYAGVLANQLTTADAVVENCSTSGMMSVALDTPSAACGSGGIIGNNSAVLTLSNLVSNVNIIVTATNTNGQTLNLGGVIGYVAAAITATSALTNNGNVDITGNYGKSLNIGGIIGYTTGAVTANGCALTNNGKFYVGNAASNQTEVSNDITFGGIVGQMYRANLTTNTSSTVTNNGAINVNNTKSSKLTLGGLYGINMGTFYNSTNTGDITIVKHTSSSWFNIGGIAGYNATSTTYNTATNEGNITISNCISSVNNQAIDIAGISGTVQATTTLNGDIINTGNITVRNHTGKSTRWIGIAGIMGGDDNKTLNINGQLNNSGTIKVIGGDFSSHAKPFGIGGIFGYMQIQPKNATNTGEVIYAANSTICQVGGLVGNGKSGISNSKSFCNVAAFTWDGTASGALTKSANVGMITGGAYAEGLVSSCHTGGKIGTSATVVTGTDGKLDVEVDYTKVENYNELDKTNYFNYLYGGTTEVTLTIVAGDSCGYIESIDDNDPYIPEDPANVKSIGTAAELVAWATGGNLDEKPIVMLTADINMAELPEVTTWTPIDGFSGKFDGDNYKIKGLKAPLFGVATASAIKNVHLENVDMDITLAGDALYAGALANQLNSDGAEVKNCSVSGNIDFIGNDPSNTVALAGLIGKVSAAATLSNLENNATITFSGSLDGRSLNLGGIAGHVDAAITAESLTNSGTINVSGIDESTNSEVGFYTSVGGIFGYTKGLTSTTTLTNSGVININNVTCSRDARIGGVIGNVAGALSVTKLTNSGTVSTDSATFSATAILGGVIGQIAEAVTLSNSTLSTSVGSSVNIKNITFSSTSQIGGIVGKIAGATTTNTSTKFTNNGTINMSNCSLKKFDFGGVVGINDAVSTLNNLTNNGAITLDNLTSASSQYFNVGGVISYNSGAGSTLNNLTNTGSLTITNSSAVYRVDIGGVMGAVNKNTNLSGEIKNTGAISCGMTINNDTEWNDIGGILGRYDKGTLDMSGVTTIENRGAVSVTGTYDGDVRLGGIFGKIDEAFTYSGPIKNSGDVTLGTGATVTDLASTYVGGIVGLTDVSISNARCYCTVTGFEGSNVGMITGSARTDGTVVVSNSYVGGVIDKKVPVSSGGVTSGWTSNPYDVHYYLANPENEDTKVITYHMFIYGSEAVELNTVINDRCGYILKEGDNYVDVIPTL